MRTTVEVAERFQGPPGTGNGGYVSGMLASYLPDPIAARGVEATLRAPTPLDVSLELASEASRIAAYSGEVLIGEAIPAALDLHVPTPPSYAQALAAQPHSAALNPHIENVVPGGMGFHPVCFCCGADVPEGIGLRVFAAPVAGFEGVAAAWRPHRAFRDDAGAIPTPMVWAALDCPGQFAYLAANIRTGLLGRMTAKILAPAVGDAFVITGWRIAVEGKKYFAGTALFNADGECCAYSKQVWIGRRD